MRSKLIEGYDWPYTIHEDGSVTGGRTKYPLKHSISAGYPRVVLYRDGKPVGKHIHRLLAEAFLPNPNNLPQVNHINAIRTDFRLENLEWCTASENQLHKYKLGYKNWNTGLELVDRKRNCEQCSTEFRYKRKSTRFCSTSCSAKWRVEHYPHTIKRYRDPKTNQFVAIELFKQGVLPAPQSTGEQR